MLSISNRVDSLGQITSLDRTDLFFFLTLLYQSVYFLFLYIFKLPFFLFLFLMRFLFILSPPPSSASHFFFILLLVITVATYSLIGIRILRIMVRAIARRFHQLLLQFLLYWSSKLLFQLVFQRSRFHISDQTYGWLNILQNITAYLTYFIYISITFQI